LLKTNRRGLLNLVQCCNRLSILEANKKEEEEEANKQMRLELLFHHEMRLPMWCLVTGK
jgi:hypothetical protein